MTVGVNMNYNKSEIMKRAWQVATLTRCGLSKGLKQAWAEVRNIEVNVKYWAKNDKEKIFFTFFVRNYNEANIECQFCYDIKKDYFWDNTYKSNATINKRKNKIKQRIFDAIKNNIEIIKSSNKIYA
jgi:hypothetical protein